MAPPTRTPQAKWIEAGLRALAAGGPDAVRIEPLAQALGVTKGGFYWHFADRRALLDALLDTWERVTTEEAIERVESEGEDAMGKLQRLFALTSSRVLAIDLAMRDWARRDATVAERLRRIDNRRMGYLRALFADVCADPAAIEARSMLCFSLLIGNHYIAADHGGRSREAVLEDTLKQLLGQC